MADAVTMSRLFEELPAPPRPALTPRQRYGRSRRFALVLNWFVLGYSLVHKLLLPVYLTSVAHSPSFAALDAWWVYHVAVGALLLRRTWDDALLRAWACFGVGGVACQFVVSFRERNWHSVSLWVTAASTLWVAFVLVRVSHWRWPASWKARRIVFQAGLAAAGFLAQFALFGFTFTVEKAARQYQRPAPAFREWPVLSDADACGVEGFRLPVEAGRPKTPSLSLRDVVDVKPCGFSAALSLFDPSRPLAVRNATGGYLNVKAYVPSEGRWRPFQNMPLPAKMEHRLEPASLAGHPVILLASDADPKKGILLLVSAPAALAAPLPAALWLDVDRSGMR